MGECLLLHCLPPPTVRRPFFALLPNCLPTPTVRRPFLCAFSDNDPVTRNGALPFIQRVPAAKDRDHPVIEGGGHFLQEGRGSELAARIAAFINET